MTTLATRTIESSWTMMGGTARACLVLDESAPPSSGADAAHPALARAQALGARFEQRWSRFIADSDVSRLTSAAGRAVTVSVDTIALLDAMRDGWRETDHDFDPTLLPAVVAEGYGRSLVDPSRSTVLPPTARARADLDAMRIDGCAVTLPSGTALDPGGIGKGLAADLIAAELLAQGVLGCLIEVGGDVRVAGEAPDGVAWRIAVEDPFAPPAVRTTIRLPDGGIATSSQRKRRWASASGSERHHLIDPATSRSAVTSIQTVTVIAATAARAEVLTKPGFLRPTADYLRWIPTRGAAALLIDADGVEHVTPNWRDYA